MSGVTALFVMTSRDWAGLVASLGCLLVVYLVIVLMFGWDQPKEVRQFEQDASNRGLFDDQRDHHRHHRNRAGR